MSFSEFFVIEEIIPKPSNWFVYKRDSSFHFNFHKNYIIEVQNQIKNVFDIDAYNLAFYYGCSSEEDSWFLRGEIDNFVKDIKIEDLVPMNAKSYKTINLDIPFHKIESYLNQYKPYK